MILKGEMNFILISITFILLLPFQQCEPLIRVCSSSQYKRIVEDTCSSVFKRNSMPTFSWDDLVDEIVEEKRSIEDEGNFNKLEKDISIKCCVVGCPYSLYAAHCELRKRNFQSSWQMDD